MLRNELERQKKALGQEVALLHKQKSNLLDRGKCRNLSVVYDQNENAGFFSIFIGYNVLVFFLYLKFAARCNFFTLCVILSFRQQFLVSCL